MCMYVDVRMLLSCAEVDIGGTWSGDMCVDEGRRGGWGCNTGKKSTHERLDWYQWRLDTSFL